MVADVADWSNSTTPTGTSNVNVTNTATANVGTSVKTLKIQITVAATSDQTIIAGVAGQTIRLLSMIFTGHSSSAGGIANDFQDTNGGDVLRYLSVNADATTIFNLNNFALPVGTGFKDHNGTAFNMGTGTWLTVQYTQS